MASFLINFAKSKTMSLCRIHYYISIQILEVIIHSILRQRRYTSCMLDVHDVILSSSKKRM